MHFLPHKAPDGRCVDAETQEGHRTYEKGGKLHISPEYDKNAFS